MVRAMRLLQSRLRKHARFRRMLCAEARVVKGYIAWLISDRAACCRVQRERTRGASKRTKWRFEWEVAKVRFSSKTITSRGVKEGNFEGTRLSNPPVEHGIRKVVLHGPRVGTLAKLQNLSKVLARAGQKRVRARVGMVVRLR
eukprot:4938722-Pleurochrysis_carterae.AAC.1